MPDKKYDHLAGPHSAAKKYPVLAQTASAMSSTRVREANVTLRRFSNATPVSVSLPRAARCRTSTRHIWKLSTSTLSEVRKLAIL